MFKHILVPTDGSQFSLDNAKRAVSFAKEAGARITAFYAKHEASGEIYWNKAAWGHLPEPSKLDEALEEEAQKILTAVKNCARTPAYRVLSCR